MNVKQLIPKEQRELIINALEAYQNSLSIAIARHEENGLGDVLHHDVFDITGLIGMMKYDVGVTLPKEHKDKFAGKHGVDFPEYCGEVMAKYPIFEKPKAEWLTVIVGTISFTDDGTHERSASIQEIISIDKYLKGGESEDVLDNLEEEGQDYLVVEEYDGLIEIDIITEAKDEREFQVVDVCGSYTTTLSFKEVTEDEDDNFIDFIDKLPKGVCHERHTNEVYIIRIK